jgi:hypothetical protein
MVQSVRIESEKRTLVSKEEQEKGRLTPPPQNLVRSNEEDGIRWEPVASMVVEPPTMVAETL